MQSYGGEPYEEVFYMFNQAQNQAKKFQKRVLSLGWGSVAAHLGLERTRRTILHLALGINGMRIGNKLGFLLSFLRKLKRLRARRLRLGPWLPRFPAAARIMVAPFKLHLVDFINDTYYNL